MKGYIYIIQNTINNKVYIGQTSRSIQERWTQHKNSALRGETQGIILYNAMRKYGIDKFYISLIEETDLENLNNREVYWIDYYQSQTPNGYNVRAGGEDCGRKEVYKIDINTNQILECYGSAMAAAEINNIDLSLLTKACRQETSNCHGFKWSYADNYDINYLKNLTVKYSRRAVYAIDPYTAEIKYEFSSISEAANSLKADASTISHALKKDHATASGYNWCYVSDYTPETFQPKPPTKVVLQYDKENHLLKEWKSAKEAALALGKYPSAIANTCRGKQKTAFGFKWKYKDDLKKEE